MARLRFREAEMISPEGNPYSALAIYGATEAHEQCGLSTRPSWLPWWMSPLAHVLILAVLAYRTFYPVVWRRRCIYTPTCSAYSLQAIRKYGGARGLAYTVMRIQRCNGTMFRGGHDPA